MKKIIKNKEKMKNTMYIVFGVFALALFTITRANPSYASDGLILDNALGVIALGNTTENPSSENKEGEEKQTIESEDIAEPGIIMEDKIEDEGEEAQEIDEEGIENTDEGDSNEIFQDSEDVDLEGISEKKEDNNTNQVSLGVSNENIDNEEEIDLTNLGDFEFSKMDNPNLRILNGNEFTVTYYPNGGEFSGMEINETKEFTYNYSGTEIIPIYNIQIPDRKSENMSVQSGWMFAGWYTKDGTNNDWGEEFDPATSTTNIAYAKWLPFNDLVITMGDKTFTIMDRNIGAKHDDEGIYSNEGNYDSDKIGYYYQWGNNYGFRGEITNSNSAISKIDSQIFEASTFYNNKFVISNDGKYGRDLPQNKNLRGQSEIYDVSRKGPCPIGYHIPQEIEWSKVIESFNNWKSSDECSQFYTNNNFSSSNYCLARKLRLPYTSYIGTNGVYYGEGKGINYRTSTHETYPQNYSLYMNNARYFEFRLSSNSIFVGQNFKSQALPIRCFKDEVKKIVYETNGGYFDNTPVTITTWWGENIRSLIAPKKNDLPNVFGGWYTTENFEEGTFVTGSNLKSDTDEIKLYAKWDANIFTLSFNADNNDTNPGNITVTYDSQYPELPVVNKTGYTFNGWYNGEEKINSGDIVRITEDTTLKAKRTINQYKIMFDTDGGNEISSIEKDYNSSLSGINLPIPTKECNEFSGWDVELPDTMPAHDITLKAIWNYTCSRSSGAGGRKSETTTREIAIDTNTENEHNSANEEQKTETSETNNILTNGETSNQVISVTQEVSEDGTVEAVVETIKIKNTDIVATVRTEVNPTNSSSSSSSSATHTKEQNDAYSFAKANGITTTESIETAKMNTELTRIQMAKMLSNFAINVLGEEPDVSKGTADFDDVTNKMDEQYDNAVTKAYQLGIMGQNVKDNEFRPNDGVTRAEFTASLSRLLYKTDEGKYKGTSKYYVPHIVKLYNEGIVNKAEPKIKEKRGYVMTMLKRTVE